MPFSRILTHRRKNLSESLTGLTYFNFTYSLLSTSSRFPYFRYSGKGINERHYDIVMNGNFVFGELTLFFPVNIRNNGEIINRMNIVIWLLTVFLGVLQFLQSKGQQMWIQQ